MWAGGEVVDTSAAPGAFQHVDPVLVTELAQQSLRETPRAQGLSQIAETGDIANSRRHLGAVKVGTEADAIDADLLDEMVKVADQHVEPSVGVDLPVGPEETGSEIDADHSARIADRGKLSIGEISRVRTYGIGIGVGCNQRRIAQARHVPEALFVQMGQVDHHPPLIAGLDQVFAQSGQSRAGIGRARKTKGHAMAKDIGPAPHETDRAQTRFIQDVQRVEIGINRLGTLDMHDRTHHAGGEAGADLLGVSADFELCRRTAALF